MRPVKPHKIREYVRPNGSNPFREWLNGLATVVGARVQARLLRAEFGNLGPYKAVGDGVFELILDFGPGYRVYFGFEGEAIILLLVGGDKSTQRKDIETAKRYWKEGDHGTTKR